MITIILLVSRDDYLERVLTSLELLDCDASRTNILCIVDGSDELYIRTRNHVNGMKFNERLAVRSNNRELPSKFDVQKRREHIASLHNQAKELIGDEVDFVFSVEDDTLIPRDSLTKLLNVTRNNPAFGLVEGVELGRWGVPYVGGWRVNDIYDTTEIKSVMPPDIDTVEKIDAGGLYCALIRADLYKTYPFHSNNGLGPDVNFGIELRRNGYDNFIHWGIECKHYTHTMGNEVEITLSNKPMQITMTKKSDTKWSIAY